MQEDTLLKTSDLTQSLVFNFALMCEHLQRSAVHESLEPPFTPAANMCCYCFS